MANWFYDLPDDILFKIYKIYFSKYILSIDFPEHIGWYDHWSGYGIYELLGTNDANLYKHKFTIWNGSKFEWTGLPYDYIDDDYGTKECPIKCDYKLRRRRRRRRLHSGVASPCASDEEPASPPGV